jgi:heat shock protein HslJ
MIRALTLALLLAACVAPPPAKNNPIARPLAGTSWVMVHEAGARAVPTIAFLEAGRASGSTGCNQWFAQVDRSEAGLGFNAIGMTRRACEPAAMEIERNFAEALGRARAAQVDEDMLTLIGENGEAVARFERVR